MPPAARLETRLIDLAAGSTSSTFSSTQRRTKRVVPCTVHLALWRQPASLPRSHGCYSTTSSSESSSTAWILENYKGDRKDGKPHGQGYVRLPDGTTITGDWVEGELVRGRQVNMHEGGGMLYEGEYRDGLFHGHGRGCNADHTYVGEWVDGVPHGHGRFVSTTERRTYEGDVSQGKPHGQGRETDEIANTVYEGQFKHGMKHGVGVMQGPHHRYEGEWVHDRVEGKGTKRWKTSHKPDSNEEQYEGEWRAGLQHGTGTLTVFHRGGRRKTILEGEWRDGLMHGQGRELTPRGVVLRSGTWARGVFVGEGQQNEQAPPPAAATETPKKKAPQRRGRKPAAQRLTQSPTSL